MLLAGYELWSQPCPHGMDADDFALGSLVGRGDRTLNTLPDRDDIASVGAEADFGLIVGYLFDVKPLESWGSIECLGMDRVVVNEKHVRQPARGQRIFALSHDVRDQ